MDEDEALCTNEDDDNLLYAEETPLYKEKVRKIIRKFPQKFLDNCNHYCSGSIVNNPYLYHDPNFYSDKSLTLCQKLFKLFTPFPYHGSLLLPVLDALSTPEQVALGQDPANFLVKKKLQLQNSITLSMKKRKKSKERNHEIVRVTKKALSKLDATQKSVLKVPDIVATIATYFAEDPDPNFCSTYNWYYNGGNISCVIIDGRKVLLSARGNNCSTLVATPLKHTLKNSNGFRVKESQTAKADMPRAGPIFQITSVSHTNSQGLIGTRQRNKCSVFVCKRESSCSLLKAHSCCNARNVPFTSLAISPWGTAQYCVAAANGAMKIWDINKNECTDIFRGYEGYHPEWLWSGLHYSTENSHTLFYTEPLSMKIIDLRDPSNGQDIFNLKPSIVYPCEEISASSNSRVNCTLQYIATTHQLFTMDIRQPGKYLQIWHHLLKSPPQYIKTCQEAPSLEIVCLGNTEESNIVSIVNEWSDENMTLFPISRSQPYCLGSLDTTLKEANLHGLCLKPSIQSRLKLNLTGICCLTLERPAVFCATAAGDVFCQRINRRFAARDEEDEKLTMLSSLTLWQEQVKEQELDSQPPTLHLSEFLDNSHLQKIIASDVTIDTGSAPKLTDLPPALWQLSRTQLFSSRDLYASRLLAAWGINDASTWDGERAKAYGEDIYLLPPPVQNIDRVNQWLSTDVLAAVPDSQASQFGTQDVAPFSQMSEVSQSTRINVTLTNQSEVGYNESQDVATVISRRQSLLKAQLSARKRKRTDGF